MTNFDAARGWTPARLPAITPTPTPSIADETSRYIATPTSNDGLPDAPKPGAYSGQRQANVDELGRVLDDVRSVQSAAQQAVEAVGGEIAKQTRMAEVADTVSKLPIGLPSMLVAGIDGIAGLFGKEFNPAKDAVNYITDAEGDRDKLDSSAATVTRSTAEVGAVTAKRSEEQVYNFMANVLKNTGMSDAALRHVDGLTDVRFRVGGEQVPGHPGADAHYDPATNTVVLTKHAYVEARATMDAIRAEEPGALDSDGKIVDFDAYERADATERSKRMAGLMVHESFHAEQHANGVGATNAKVADEDHGVEYPAYLAQEQALLRGGSERRYFVTINPDGSKLPEDQGRANVDALVSGEPLLYGVSSGEVPSPESASGGEHEHDSGDAGRGWPGTQVGRGWPGTLVGRGWPGTGI